MIPSGLIAVLAVIAWVSTIVLVRAAWPKPRIGALTERAVIAVVLSVFLTIYAIAALNTDGGHPVFDVDTGRTLVRVFVVILGFLPTYWTILWFSGRLGPGGKG